MSAAEEPPDAGQVFGDPFGPLQQAVSKAMMDAFMRLPALLDRQVEGGEGPVDVPPEQMAEAMKNALTILMDVVPRIAGALDMARGRITQLEKRLTELEQRGSD
jgi:hypothetical protein